MNKNLLICGSAIAVVILVLASFSPVVGSNTVKSSLKDSPLFNIRTSRAIDQDIEGLTCRYVGKGKFYSFLLPKRNNQIEKLSKAIDVMSKIDYNSFNNFVAQVMHHLQYQNEFIEIETSEIVQTFHYIRANPDAIKHVATQEVVGDDTDDCTRAYPGCFIVYFILLFLAWLYYSILTHFFISIRITNCAPLCPGF